jgi:hypothetical protein
MIAPVLMLRGRVEAERAEPAVFDLDDRASADDAGRLIMPFAHSADVDPVRRRRVPD